MPVFTALFIVLLVTSFGLRYWLMTRQIHHVQTHRDHVPDAFAGHVDPEKHRIAAAYTAAKTRAARLQLFAEAAYLLAMTLGGGIQALSDWATGLMGQGIGTGTLFLILLMGLTALLDMPFDLWRQFGIEVRFGFNRQGLRGYLADFLRQLALGTLFGAPFVFLILTLMQHAGSAWWLWAWAAWAVFNLTLLAIYPTLIAPLFNRFTPLENPTLQERIEALLQRCGFRSSGVFVMDGSRRSNHGNAYFTGLGRSRRVVFFDTLLNQLDPPQVEAVLAHELGHARLHHIRKRLALMFAASLALLVLLAILKDAPWFYTGLNVHTPTDAIALALFFLTLPVFAFPLKPVMSLGSRKHEFEADRFAAQHSRADDLISALYSLYRENAATLTPDPLYALFYDSHPKPTERIARLKGI